MNILIIGGTRFFGIHTVKQLLADGHCVTVATRGGHGNPFGNSVRHLVMDKNNGESVRSAVGGAEYDVVIDKVAYASNDVRSLLSNIRCGRYIQMSSCAVYQTAHPLIVEEEFDARQYPLCWMDRPADYAEGKRQAERAALEYMDIAHCTFVRYPVVLGEHDYTDRLRFYIRHIRSGIPMNMDRTDAATAYIHEYEAGEFLAHLVSHPVSGAVNGAAKGMISQNEIVSYIEQKTGRNAVITPEGEPAPYNGIRQETTYDCTKAAECGFSFSKLRSWIFDLIDSDLSL